MKNLDRFITTDTSATEHRDECCTVVNSHWEEPRCNCDELNEKDRQDRQEELADKWRTNES